MRKYYRYSPWFQKAKRVIGQFIIPFCIFQGIRTLLFPTLFDFLLLVFFIWLAVIIYFENI